MALKFLDNDGLLYFWQKLKAYFVKAEAGKGLSANDYTAEDKAKLAGLENYELPTASAETLGGVKVGAGLRIDEGVLSATRGGTADAVDWSGVQNKPEAYPPESHTHTAGEITDLESAISTQLETGEYLNPDNLEATLSEKGYQTAEAVEQTIEAKGYQTASDVRTAIGKAGHLKRQIVDSLPNAGEADADTIYMIPIPEAEGQNKYTEWMVIEGAWESLGTRDVDLSGYVKTEDLQSITNGEIDGLVSA